MATQENEWMKKPSSVSDKQWNKAYDTGYRLSMEGHAESSCYYKNPELVGAFFDGFSDAIKNRFFENA